MTKTKLRLATRKWKRQFNEAVAGSIAKTITEPVTNSYDSYKRMSGRGNTGLVDAIFSLKSGYQFSHEDIASKLRAGTQHQIQIILNSTGKRVGVEKRECQVVDFAEGMSSADMNDKFAKYGADKSGASKGLAVRGLFGQGICDVLYSHTPGSIRSIKDDMVSICDFTWEGPDGDEEPYFDVSDSTKATTRIRRDLGITSGNGTNVSFVLDPVCRIPAPETLAARLSQFYMLRLITSDPSCRVSLQQIRSKGEHEDTLAFNFPTGQVIHTFRDTWVLDGFAPMALEGTLIRANVQLPGRDSGEERLSGLLIVDEFDTVYDQSFFAFESSPYLDHIYGIVRITGVRQILKKALDEDRLALLTETRDGFAAKTDFLRSLTGIVSRNVESTFKREIERRAQPTKGLSEGTDRKLKRGLKRLNELFEDVTKKSSPFAPGAETVRVPAQMDFEEKRIQVRLQKRRYLRLLANPARFRNGSQVIVDSDSDDIEVEPKAAFLEAATDGKVLMATVCIIGTRLGATCELIAVAQNQAEETIDCEAEVTDVIVAEQINPPDDGLMFDPLKSKAAPHRRGHLALLVNPEVVSLGTDISLRRSKGDPAIKLVDDAGLDRDDLCLPFTKDHLLPGGAVGRILIAYRGYGFGQAATLVADCFPRGKNVRAIAEVVIEEPRPTAGGIFKDVQYNDLPGRFAKHASEFDPTTGYITINRLHPVNRAVFGLDTSTFAAAIENDREAQFRLAEVVVGQCLYHMLAVANEESEVMIDRRDPVGSIRAKIEAYKSDVEEDVFRYFVDEFRVPRV